MLPAAVGPVFVPALMGSFVLSWVSKFLDRSEHKSHHKPVGGVCCEKGGMGEEEQLAVCNFAA